MLMAVPKFGRVKAARLLNQCRISQSKTVGGLSERQAPRDLAKLSATGASAGRARAARLRRHRASGAGKGTLIRGPCSSAFPGSRSRSPPRRGRGGRVRSTVAILVPRRRRVHAQGRRGRVPGVGRVRVGSPVRTLRSEMDGSPRRGRPVCSSWRLEGALRVQVRGTRQRDRLHRLRRARARAASARARDRVDRRDRRPDRAGPHSSSSEAHLFRYVVRNDDVERAT